MLAFVVAMIGIEFYQEFKTDRTLQALKDLSAPTIEVLRNGEHTVISSVELVPGDLMTIEEGVKIPADGWVIRESDLTVDESTLTGESLAVTKLIRDCEGATTEGNPWRADYVYAGTLVQQGFGIIEVATIGPLTEYGKIGTDILETPDRPTPLEKQTAKLVKVCAWFAFAMFAIVAALTYFNPSSELIGTAKLFAAILGGITIAMSLLPEEFPVILTVFLSMGASRLAKRNSLVRKLSSVETLGSISVLCSDKTGTITKNHMELTDTWVFSGTEEHMLHAMGLACEIDAYDPMEIAMLEYCEDHGISRDHLFHDTLLLEYAFTNETKMMGHVWLHDGEITVSAKGSAEKLIALCGLDKTELARVEKQVLAMANEGLRVIAIAEQHIDAEQDIPATLEQCHLTLEGLVGLSDPPREGVAQDIATAQNAGIRVIMITGDNGVTASAIARQVGLAEANAVITGDELSEMTDAELAEKVEHTSIFSRVIPEHKMRIVRALQANGEVVAMTGDGVNDAPALKHADIGIAMGKRGSEVAREAADLILLDDNFSTIVETVKNGRRIYDNIKKAVGYVFAIHIPIAAAAFFAPLLRIPPASLMIMPIHVLLLELVIDPTCSIVLEREPAESGIMDRPPNPADADILSKDVLVKSVAQGITIALASFLSYYFLLTHFSADAAIARAVGLGIMLVSSLALVFVNSSNYDYALTSMKRLLHDKVMWIAVIGVIGLLLFALYSPLDSFFNLAPLSPALLAYTFAAGIASVAWYELVKVVQHVKRRDLLH
jgi:Ca2+-transporting ATPase